MHWLAPLPVAIPLIVAAAIAATSFLGRRVADWLALLTAVAVAGLSIAIFVHVGSGHDVYWFSGWKPVHGIALGVSFTVDRFGAGMAVLVSVLMVAALTFAWHFFDQTVEHRFPILMLVFLAAMVGFSLSGDLFNMFVFFELMGVAAYALTGYKVETRAPLQGALNFAISNSVAGYLILLGIGLVYAHTGALNLAQLGRTIGAHHPDGLVVVAFTLLTVGFMVKAAIVPFHFWLADAHAVAPTPVCVLFSGAMVELGLYGIARIYWTVFAGSFGPHSHALSHVLIGLGVLTAIVGAVMCFLQQHIKRLLAFSTVSHMGLFLIGFGLLDHSALGGVAIYVLAHGAVKGALFICTGIVLHRLRGVDEEARRGAGRVIPWTGVLFAIGGLALADLPPFGTGLGAELIESSASKAGNYHWMPWLFGLTAALTAGAVLRVAGRVFLGWGPRELDRFPADRFGELEDETETVEARERTPKSMFVPALLLLAAGLALGLVPHLATGAQHAAAHFQDQRGYATAVLDGKEIPAATGGSEHPTLTGRAYGLISTAAAIGLAALALFRKRLPAWLRAAGRAVDIRPALLAVRRVHSGHIGDYIAWLTLGLAGVGGLFSLALR
jgi:multicomponent Na+:H+ antiporter subunit D